MGVNCSKKVIYAKKKEEEGKPAYIHQNDNGLIPTAILNSQNLDELSENLRASIYKIPIIKEDIRLVYKFEKQIGNKKHIHIINS